MKKEKIFKNASTKVVVIAAIILILIGGFFIFLTNKKIAEKKQPKTWVETFKNPIDPNTQPEKHKEVYEKIQKIVHFPIKYPTKLPEGYKLVRVESIGSASYFIYKKEAKELQLFEGIGDLGNVKELQLVNIDPDYQAVLWKSGTKMGITLYPKRGALHTYIITANNHESKDDLIDIAKFLSNKF